MVRVAPLLALLAAVGAQPNCQKVGGKATTMCQARCGVDTETQVNMESRTYGYKETWYPAYVYHKLVDAVSSVQPMDLGQERSFPTYGNVLDTLYPAAGLSSGKFKPTTPKLRRRVADASSQTSNWMNTIEQEWTAEVSTAKSYPASSYLSALDLKSVSLFKALLPGFTAPSLVFRLNYLRETVGNPAWSGGPERKLSVSMQVTKAAAVGCKTPLKKWMCSLLPKDECMELDPAQINLASLVNYNKVEGAPCAQTTQHEALDAKVCMGDPKIVPAAATITTMEECGAVCVTNYMWYKSDLGDCCVGFSFNPDAAVANRCLLHVNGFLDYPGIDGTVTDWTCYQFTGRHHEPGEEVGEDAYLPLCDGDDRAPGCVEVTRQVVAPLTADASTCFQPFEYLTASPRGAGKAVSDAEGGSAVRRLSAYFSRLAFAAQAFDMDDSQDEYYGTELSMQISEEDYDYIFARLPQVETGTSETAETDFTVGTDRTVVGFGATAGQCSWRATCDWPCPLPFCHWLCTLGLSLLAGMLLAVILALIIFGMRRPKPAVRYKAIMVPVGADGEPECTAVTDHKDEGCVMQ